MLRVAAKILYIDAYDSYANNIIAIVQQHTLADVTVIHHDDPDLLALDEDAWSRYLQRFDAAIAGPGPGNPTNAEDIGLISRLWLDRGSKQLPVLGICLGFQSLGLAHGAAIRRLKDPKHGTRVSMVMNPLGPFGGAHEATVVQYNSLCVNLGYEKGATRTAACWKPSKKCPDLVPLAWSRGDPTDRVLFGMRHARKPFWGVQYHPESICTDSNGAQILQSWLRMVVEYWVAKSRRDPLQPKWIPNDFSNRASRMTAASHVAPSLPSVKPTKAIKQNIADVGIRLNEDRTVRWRKIPLGNHDVLSIRDAQCSQEQTILLESGTTRDGSPVRPDTGRFSIIGIQYDSTPITITFGTAGMQVTAGHYTPSLQLRDKQDPFVSLQNIVQQAKMDHGCPDVPFWGGLIGFISYEGCLPCVDVKPTGLDPGRPDLCFVFVHRSIVVDHVDKSIYIQTIAPNDESWLDKVVKSLQQQDNVDRSTPPSFGASLASTGPDLDACLIFQETSKAYQTKVAKAQEHIAAGSSYELCLTGATHLSLPKTTSPNDLYTSLRAFNPAPFSAYLSIPIGHTGQRVTVLSSSPERFLSFSRNGKCQFRPIKGTVRKSPTTTRADAEAILKSSKEQAENLMIVDLIRHDLHGVVGAGNVQVPKLMGVEEYETCYQLVSVIEGQLPTSPSPHSSTPHQNNNTHKETHEPTNPPNPPTGITLLRASLPPGSMTGAPKKRSVQLLQDLEDHKPRGIYSGVLGYLDVGGGGDFSVVIRSAVNWSSEPDLADEKKTKEQKKGESEQESEERTQWTIGAGGAITSQSTPQDEWAEMQGKRAALLSVFLGKGGVEAADELSNAD